MTITPNLIHSLDAALLNSISPIVREPIGIMVYESPDDFGLMAVELSDYWDTIDKLEEATSREFIQGYSSSPTLEACLNLKDLDYTIWVLGTPHEECHQ